MKIREFKFTDQNQVIGLWNECELIVPWNNPCKDIERKMKISPDLFLVGELSGNLIASVMGGYEGHRGWINYLAVSPQYRRNGYARNMMEAVESRLKDKGCPKINLQIRKSNLEVLAFYEALGYKPDQVINLGKRIELDD